MKKYFAPEIHLSYLDERDIITSSSGEDSEGMFDKNIYGNTEINSDIPEM